MSLKPDDSHLHRCLEQMEDELRLFYFQNRLRKEVKGAKLLKTIRNNAN